MHAVDVGQDTPLSSSSVAFVAGLFGGEVIDQVAPFQCSAKLSNLGTCNTQLPGSLSHSRKRLTGGMCCPDHLRSDSTLGTKQSHSRSQ